LPWKIGDFIFRNLNKSDEFANHFHNLNLKYAEMIKGFDPNKIFVEHMLTIGFNNSFIHIVLSEEEDNKLGTPAHNAGDLETILSTNEFYKHKERVPTRRAPNPQLSLLRLPHLGVMLQWPTQPETLPTLVQTTKEKRIPLQEKSRACTNFL
jgi:hypothetical protein